MSTKSRPIDAKAAAATAGNRESAASVLEALDGLSDAVDRLLAKHPNASPALLERLSHSSDKTARKNVVLNASASKETLIRLAPQFPAEFFSNPAFDWLLVEDPSLPIHLGHGVLKNVLKRPDCPQVFMRWAASKGSEQEKLAVAMNPAASTDIVAQLSQLPDPVGQAARSHVNAATPRPAEAADGRTVVRAEVRIALAELTPEEARSYWKRGIVGPAKWAPLSLSARLDVLGLVDWEYRDDWLAQYPEQLAAVADEPMRVWLKEVSRAASPEFTLARDILAAPADLERLAATKDVELMALIARNPALPPPILNSLALDKRTAVREAVAANQATPEAMLQQLAADKQAGVRAEVAANPAADPALVATLAQDKAADVRQAAKIAAVADVRAARSIRTPADALSRLATAKKSEVRLAVARNPSAPEGARAAAYESILDEAGPNKLMELADELGCPLAQRNRARARRWWRELGLAAERCALPTGAEPLPPEPEMEVLVRMLSEEAGAMLLHPGRTLLAGVLGYREGDLLTLPNDEADTACNAKARAVRLMGLMHPQAGPEAMAKRSKSTDWVERLAIACNPACAPSILSSLEKDANQTVAHQVASTRLAKAADQDRRSAVVQSESDVEVPMAVVVDEIRLRLKKCRAWLLQGTAWWPWLSFQQRLGVPEWPTGLEGKSPADLIAILEALSSTLSQSRAMSDGLAQIWNWRRRDKVLSPIADRAFASALAIRALVTSSSADIRALVASNPNLEQADAIVLATDQDVNVRRAAIASGKLPNELLHRMACDTELEERPEAIRRAALPNDVIVELSQEESERAMCGLALNRRLPSEVQQKLAADKRPDVRAALAANPSTSSSTLAALAADKVYKVRLAAAANPSISADMLEALAADKEDWVRRSVAANPVATVSLLLKLARDQVYEISGAAEGQIKESQGISDADLTSLARDTNPETRKLAAANPRTSAAIMRVLATDANRLVKAYLAMNENAPADVIETLADDPDDWCNENAVAHPSVPLKVLANSVKSKSPLLRRAVARNPSTPSDLLDALSNDPDRDVRLTLLENRNLPIKLLKSLATEIDDPAKYFPALLNVARSPLTEPGDLQHLGRESFYIVRFAALANDRYPARSGEADRGKLQRDILSQSEGLPPLSRGISEPELLMALTALDMVPTRPDAKWAAKSAKSKDWLTRLAAILSGVAPPSLLQQLVDDPVDVVRQLAISRLRAIHAQGLKP